MSEPTPREVELKHELAEERRQNAAMREALMGIERESRLAFERDECELECEWLIEACRAAIQPDAGAQLLTLEQVRPLVEALQRISMRGRHFDGQPVIGNIHSQLAAGLGDLGAIARDAIAHAKSLGL